jgi:hypothetical protein
MSAPSEGLRLRRNSQTLADRAFQTWVECRRLLESEVEVQQLTFRELSDLTGQAWKPERLHRVLRGQERLTVELFAALCEALRLCPGKVLTDARRVL